MLAIRLPQSIEKRLEKLARRTGRTKTYYAREAILEHLEDLEDLYLAEGALERIRSGEERTIPLKDAHETPWPGALNCPSRRTGNSASSTRSTANES